MTDFNTPRQDFSPSKFQDQIKERMTELAKTHMRDIHQKVCERRDSKQLEEKLDTILKTE